MKKVDTIRTVRNAPSRHLKRQHSAEFKARVVALLEKIMGSDTITALYISHPWPSNAF